MVWWKAVSNTATWGVSGKLAMAMRMPSRLGGLCRGARGAWSAMAWMVAASTRVGAVSRSPPCTTRWPMPARSVIGPPAFSNALKTRSKPSEWSAMRSSTTIGSASPARWVSLPPASPIRSTTPEASALGSPASSGISNSWYLMDDDPVLTTRTLLIGDPRGRLGLDGGDGHGVDDVGDQGAPGQVVDRLAQALEDRPDGDRVGRPLHRLVGVVAGVEVGEHEHGGPAGDLAVGQLGPGDRGVDGGVVLDRPLDQEVGAALPGDRGGLADLLDVAARARLAGRVGEQGDPRLDAELGGRARRGDGDVGQLPGVGVGDHGAVAVDQHPVGQQHQEHAGHDRGAGHGADELE